MDRLFLLMLSLSAATLAGIGVIVVLVLGYYTVYAILISAAIGAALGVPVAYYVARRVRQADPQNTLSADRD